MPITVDPNQIICVISLTKAYPATGTYPAFSIGDKIYVYWNALTSQIVVKQNKASDNSFTTITDGPQDIFDKSQITNVQPQKSSGGTLTTRFTSYYLFCAGTTLNTFTGTYYMPFFPYVSRKQQANSPSCSIVVVCDLKFTNVPLITSPTNIYSHDGNIQVYASSSHGPIRFSLSDQEYSAMTNTSGLFSGLGIGNYTIYATDAGGCKANTLITIPSATLYQTKFRMEINDQQHGTTSRVDIQERGYSGSPIAIEGMESPWVLSKPQTDLHNKFEVIRPTFCTLNLASKSNYQFLTLFTQDDRKYLVSIYKPVGTLIWSGYVKPSVFSENMGIPTYATTVNVVDGMEDLSDINFLDSNGSFTDFYGNRIFGTRITGIMRVIDIIKIVLNKLELHLPYRIACNISEVDLGIDPIINAYFDCDTFWDHSQNQPWKCNKVLEALLAPAGCFVIQAEGRWNIIRTEEQCAPYDYVDLDENLTLIGTGTSNHIVEIKDPSLRMGAAFADIDQSTLEIVPAYGIIEIKHNLIAKTSLLQDFDFDISNFDGINFKGWLIDRSYAPGVTIRCDQVVIDNVADQINKLLADRKFDVTVGSYALSISNIDSDPSLYPFTFFEKGPTRVIVNPAPNPPTIIPSVDVPSGGSFIRISSIEQPIEFITDSFDFSFDYRFNLADVIYDSQGNVIVNTNSYLPWIKLRWKIELTVLGLYFSTTRGWISTETWNNVYVSDFDSDNNFKQTISLPLKTTMVTDKIKVSFWIEGINHSDVFNTTEANDNGYPYYFIDQVRSIKTTDATTQNPVIPTGYKIKVFQKTVDSTNSRNQPYSGIMRYYELKETDDTDGITDSVGLRIFPNDFNASYNRVCWEVDSLSHDPAYPSAYEFKEAFYPPTINLSKIYLDNVIIAFNPLFSKVPSLEDLVVINNEKIKENLSIELNGGDLPDVPINSAKYIYLNYLRNSAGTPCGAWQREGISGEANTIQQILLKSLIKQYSAPSYKISGNLLGYSDLNFLTVIKHSQPAIPITILNPELTWSGSSTIITGWKNIVLVPYPLWTGSSDNKATVSLATAYGSSYLVQDPAVPITAAIRLSIDINCTRTGSGSRIDELRIILLDASNNIVEDILVAAFQYNDTISKTIRFNVTQDSANIGFYIKNIVPGGDATYKVDYFRLTALTVVRFYYFNMMDRDDWQNMYTSELVQLIPLTSGADTTVDDTGDNGGGSSSPGGSGGFSGAYSSGFGAGFDTILN